MLVILGELVFCWNILLTLCLISSTPCPTFTVAIDNEMPELIDKDLKEQKIISRDHRATTSCAFTFPLVSNDPAVILLPVKVTEQLPSVGVNIDWPIVRDTSIPGAIHSKHIDCSMDNRPKQNMLQPEHRWDPFYELGVTPMTLSLLIA